MLAIGRHRCWQSHRGSGLSTTSLTSPSRSTGRRRCSGRTIPCNTAHRIRRLLLAPTRSSCGESNSHLYRAASLASSADARGVGEALRRATRAVARAPVQPDKSPITVAMQLLPASMMSQPSIRTGSLNGRSGCGEGSHLAPSGGGVLSCVADTSGRAAGVVTLARRSATRQTSLCGDTSPALYTRAAFGISPSPRSVCEERRCWLSRNSGRSCTTFSSVV